MTFEYDIAFSFLAKDEELAAELNDLLQDRLSTFLYSKRQEALAGKDGELEFNAVFGEQARLVVVLYRGGWGDTPWTRIEQTAIRNRAYDEGYDFVIFIPLDDPPIVPKWLPKTQIWVGLDRWGSNGAASVIEARVQELGGQPREESNVEKAARVERAIEFAERRRHFLRSYNGVNASIALFSELLERTRAEVEKINESSPIFELSLKERGREFIIVGRRSPGLLVSWDVHYANSLDDAMLEVTVWRGHPPWPGLFNYERPVKLQSQKFEFDIEPSGAHCWRSVAEGRRLYSSTNLASYLVAYYIDQTEVRQATA